MRVAAQVMLTAIERRRLETWASARSTTVRLVERSKIVLMACAGMPNQAIAKALGIDQNTGSPETGVGGLRPVGSADKGGAAEERRLGTEVDSRL